MPRTIFGDWWPELSAGKNIASTRALTRPSYWWYKTGRRWLMAMLSINDPPPAPKPMPRWLKRLLIALPLTGAVAAVLLLCIKTGLG